MQIRDAQREMCAAYLGGFAGQLIAGVIWAVSAAFTLAAASNMGIAVFCAWMRPCRTSCPQPE